MVISMRTLTREIDRRREGLVAQRRDFHRHPELSFEERTEFRLNEDGLPVGLRRGLAVMLNALGG
jgi:hypothetical protein